MTAPFAAIEARINAAVVSHLANATADFGGGVVVDGEFSTPYAEAFGMAAGYHPTFRSASTALSGIAENASVTIQGSAFTVSEIHADGTGMALLILAAA